ncbi:DUF4397 domain-containing protein [Vallitalea guaymasensis]|uniref:DUF4397 domain-containing protein n=1 Tax=Vallitalea guaymasensis TaxID=1185412 RepID=A0A8J8MD54_9FIRM|nr:DUF4397 domain-containing protein [Vallitalea guaymasensis]QUH30485.1 DUF4397 domain-containing protein [Vallitalea guaymasensis]
MRDKKTSYIRLLHASPKAPAVDVYANGDNILADDLSYGEFTPYLPVMPGTYTIDIYPADNSDTPILTKELVLPEKTIATIAAIGELPELELFIVEDPKEPLQPNTSKIRFVHLSPDAPAVDVIEPNGSILFKDVSYKDITDYLSITPDTYTVEIAPTGTDNSVLFVPNIRLLPDAFYSLYAIGLVEGDPYLQLLIPLDGNSYIET